MKNKNKTANPGLLIMALLLVLLALVVVLVAVILATDTGNKGANDTPIQIGSGTTSGSTTQTPITTLPQDTTTNQGGTQSTTVPNTQGSTTTQPPTTTTPGTGTTTPQPGKTNIQVSSSATKSGALILVNNDNLINYREKFPARSELVGNTALQKELGLVRVKGTGNYKMPHSNHFLTENAAEYFYDMMEAFVKQNGSSDIFLRNAYYCDYSEKIPHANIHATGNAVDLQIMNDNGQFSLKSNSEFYKWFIDNCNDYGYIYVGDTQNSSSSSGYSTFRFVGTAHSGCMEVYSMDLEQYLSYISKITADSYLRITDKYNVEWWIYYVEASNGETTEVPVYGDESCYEISGDNRGGFIVTINSSKLGQ